MNILWISAIVGFHAFAMFGMIGFSNKLKVVTAGFIMTLDLCIAFWVGLHLIGSIKYSECNQRNIR